MCYNMEDISHIQNQDMNTQNVRGPTKPASPGGAPVQHALASCVAVRAALNHLAVHHAAEWGPEQYAQIQPEGPVFDVPSFQLF